MKANPLSLSLSLCLMCVFATSDAHAFDPPCYNTAYAYCCDITAEFTIYCPGAPNDECVGSVYNGGNGYEPILVPGQYTEGSFDVDGSELFPCNFYAPICLEESPFCDLDDEVTYRYCVAWKRLLQFSECL